jgi:transcriptional regulator with XRE-family HTH domain
MTAQKNSRHPARGAFGQALQDLITEARWTLGGLSRQTGVSRQTLYNLLAGGAPAVGTVSMLATGLATHPMTGEVDEAFRARAWYALVEAASRDAGQPPPPAPPHAPVTESVFSGDTAAMLLETEELPDDLRERVRATHRQLLDMAHQLAQARRT